MSVLALLGQGGLPANLNDLKTTGQVRMKIEPTTKQPQWVMNAYCAAAVTAGLPYAIWWTSKRPTATTPATGFVPVIGFAAKTTTAAGFSEFIVAGYAYGVVATSAIPIGSGVEVLNGGVIVIDDGADGPLMSPECIGHAQTAMAGDVVDVWLYGRMYVEVSAS